MNILDNDMNEEIFEALNFTINSGYYNKNDIRELASEYLEEIFEDYDYTTPTQVDIEAIINNIQQDFTENSHSNNYLRLRKVLDQLNKEGIIAIDYAGFDMSEGHEEVGLVFQFMKENNIPRKGYCFFHQQDIERSMDSSNQTLYLAFHSTDGDEKTALSAGKRIVELLKEADFSILWDESLNERIAIQNFKWDKLFNQADVGVDRAIRIMRETFLNA